MIMLYRFFYRLFIGFCVIASASLLSFAYEPVEPVVVLINRSEQNMTQLNLEGFHARNDLNRDEFYDLSFDPYDFVDVNRLEDRTVTGRLVFTPPFWFVVDADGNISKLQQGVTIEKETLDKYFGGRYRYYFEGEVESQRVSLDSIKDSESQRASLDFIKDSEWQRLAENFHEVELPLNSAIHKEVAYSIKSRLGVFRDKQLVYSLHENERGVTRAVVVYQAYLPLKIFFESLPPNINLETNPIKYILIDLEGVKADDLHLVNVKVRKGVFRYSLSIGYSLPIVGGVDSLARVSESKYKIVVPVSKMKLNSSSAIEIYVHKLGVKIDDPESAITVKPFFLTGYGSEVIRDKQTGRVDSGSELIANVAINNLIDNLDVQNDRLSELIEKFEPNYSR